MGATKNARISRCRRIPLKYTYCVLVDSMRGLHEGAASKESARFKAIEIYETQLLIDDDIAAAKGVRSSAAGTSSMIPE